MSMEGEENIVKQMESEGLQLLKHGDPNLRKVAKVFTSFYKYPALN